MTETKIKTDWSEYSKSLLQHIDKIFDHFGLELKTTSKYFYGTCPCHLGDNTTAFNLYYSGEIPCWVCRTHECNKIFGGNLFGLVRGLLSQRRYNWVEKGNKEATLKETIFFIKSLLSIEPDKFNLREEDEEKNKFVGAIKAMVQPQKIESKISREQVRQFLIRPPEYYLKRGFSKKILDEYDVGLCLNPKSELYSRNCFPIYNSDMKMIAATGRSSFEKCPKCLSYHNPKMQCPNEEIRWVYSKWRNTKDFKKEEYFFNIWRAYNHIRESGLAILTESPGNILRLEEAGFPYGLATLGSTFSDYQQYLLGVCGATNVILCNDNDKAGQKCNEDVIERLKNSYCLRIFTPKTDLGDMRVEDLQKELGPLVKKCLN